MQDIPRTSIRELAHIIKRYEVPRFAFFLGAGASRQSGIITAGEMIRHFKEQIIAQVCPDTLKKDEEKTKWLSEQGWYQADGTEYCKCFERFEPKVIGRQRYIESIIEKREPSFGYVVLANLLARGHVNTIVTTNFDDLVYSACTTFTGIRPIVYAYGIMASEMRLTAHRPKILKLHGDYLYSALKNTGSELTAQDPNMARQFRQVLSEYGLIVVGYGGGDKSVMEILADISPSNDLYWCVRRGDKINEDVEKLLREKRGYIVEIEGFDEMMNEVRRVVDFDVKKMLGSIEERRNQIIKYLEKFEPQYSTDILSDIVDATKEPETKAGEDKTIPALDYLVRAYKAQEAKDLSTAEKLYRKAIELNPGYFAAHYNLGNLLRDLKRGDEAVAAFRKAIELEPNYAGAYYNLGNLLRVLKRDDEAEAAYRKAIEINPKYPNPLLGLASIHKKLGHETESGQYAAQARALFEPDDWYNLACLESVCGNTDAAIENLRHAAKEIKSNRDWARRDPDFEWIRDDSRFKEIVGEEGAG
jgi:tetratricopeptide (TPR) repeat protein